MISIRSIIALAAAAVVGLSVHAEPTVAPKDEARPAPAQSAPQSGLKQDVRRAWADTPASIHRAGREIREGARSAGRATGEAFRSGWRKVKQAFAGTPEPAKPAGAS